MNEIESRSRVAEVLAQNRRPSSSGNRSIASSRLDLDVLLLEPYVRGRFNEGVNVFKKC